MTTTPDYAGLLERLEESPNHAFILAAYERRELITALRTLLESNKELERERDEARKQAIDWSLVASRVQKKLDAIRRAIKVKGGDEHSPTWDAYEAACRAIDKHRARAEAAEAERDRLAERVAELEAVLEPIRRHYEVNDLDERGEEDALEIPVYDLRAAVHALVKGR